MSAGVGKFDVKPAVRYQDRWNLGMLEPMSFVDTVHGKMTVPLGFGSDLASIRILREICRWCAMTAITGGAIVEAYAWLRMGLWAVALLTLALYGLLAGYGMRASILHDWLYTYGTFSRRDCDAIYYRALTTGDGLARWRGAIFWVGVRLGGHWKYRKLA